MRLRDQGKVVTTLHVGFMDTDTTARLDVLKADPRDIARTTAGAIATGQFEVLADETTCTVKFGLSRDSRTSAGSWPQHDWRLRPREKGMIDSRLLPDVG